MRLSSLADYAVVMMGAAARRCGSASLVDAEGRKRGRTSATELAAETGIPLPTAQKLVSLLTRAGLLKSVRGAGGGIKLARPSAAISLADIIEAIEGPIAMTNCTAHSACTCTIAPDCSVKPHWGAVNDALRGALGGVSLATLCRSAPA